MTVHVLFSASLFIAVFMGLLFLWQRDRRLLARLRHELKTANQTQQTQSDLLTQRASLDSLKDEFVATVSHELRTPLTSIHGSLRLLAGNFASTLDPKAAHLLRIAVSNTDRLIRLTNDILDLQRMDSGRAPLNLRRCSLRELAQESVDTMAAAADAAQIRLELAPQEASQADLAYFDGDRDTVLQILTNLLSNAIKFSPSSSTVRISITTRAASVMLRVEDQGRGIPADKLESIFVRFQQVEAGDARDKGGTGLGLAICRTIAQQHNGAIWAKPNESGVGISFFVELPRSGRASDSATTKPATLVSSATSTVLLCDDDLHVRGLVSEQLRQQGYIVVEAERGERVLEITAEKAVDLILLDLYLPGLSGWETLRRLKASPATAGIPVVILSVLPRQSAFGARRLLGQYPAAKAQGWIQKPFQDAVLLSEIWRVLHAGDDPARILLVQQDKDLASAILDGLRDANVLVEHVTTRQDAVQRCLGTRPDLIILDLGLPDGDGFSLVTWLRTQAALRSLPLVIYSGREIAEAEKAQLRLGPTQFLTKTRVPPQDLDHLALSMVREARSPQTQTLSA